MANKKPQAPGYDPELEQTLRQEVARKKGESAALGPFAQATYGRKPAAGPTLGQRIGGVVRTVTTQLTKPFEPTDTERMADAALAYNRQRKVSPSHVTSGNRGTNSTGNYRSPSTTKDQGR